MGSCYGGWFKQYNSVIGNIAPPRLVKLWHNLHQIQSPMSRMTRHCTVSCNVKITVRTCFLVFPLHLAGTSSSCFAIQPFHLHSEYHNIIRHTDNTLHYYTNGQCDMLKYICPEVEMSTRGLARVLTSQLRDIYILACHMSPLCVICFVASLTKIWLNSIKNSHFTGTEWYDTEIMSRHNYVMS